MKKIKMITIASFISGLSSSVTSVAAFKAYKEKYLNRFRDLQTDILMGLEDPLTQEEISWYRNTKNLDPLIADLPIVPERIRDD